MENDNVEGYVHDKGILIPSYSPKMTLDEIGHEKAKSFIYPKIFSSGIVIIDNVGNSNYGYMPILKTDDEKEKLRKQQEEKELRARKKTLDYQLAIDTVISVKTNFEGISTLTNYTFQERTVSIDYGEICIRLENDNGRPSEFFNFGATHLLFMVVIGNRLKRWVWVPHATRIIEMVKNNLLKYTKRKNSKTYSTFITIKISDLKSAIPEVVEWEESKEFGERVH